MASVLPDHQRALLSEVRTVLTWATELFGSPSCAGDDDDADEWTFDLQASDAAGTPLAIAWDMQRAQVLLPATVGGRLALTLTVSGQRAFAEAFRQAFPDSQQ
jgi:hypothetical protein